MEAKNKSLKEQQEYIRSQDGTGDDNDFNNIALRSMARLDEALAYRESEKIPHIIMALQKIDNGTYGKCHHCHKEIAEGRLEAIPYAHSCIECQKKIDADWQKENGDYIHYYWQHVEEWDYGLLQKYVHKHANTDYINHR